jgi:hypothetical protein
MVIHLNRENWEDVKALFLAAAKLIHDNQIGPLQQCDSFDKLVYQVLKSSYLNQQFQISEFYWITRVQFSEFCAWILAEYCLNDGTKDFVTEAIDAHERIASGKNITKKRGGQIVEFRPGGTSIRQDAQDAIKGTGLSLTGVNPKWYQYELQGIITSACACKSRFLTGYEFNGRLGERLYSEYRSKFSELESAAAKKLVDIIYKEK